MSTTDTRLILSFTLAIALLGGLGVLFWMRRRGDIPRWVYVLVITLAIAEMINGRYTMYLGVAG